MSQNPLVPLTPRPDALAPDVRLRDALVVVLTLATGATDAMAITRLGGVLASVMTANLVFLGLAAAERSVSLAFHVGVAVLAFMLGVIAGSRVAGQRRDHEPVWPASVTRSLAMEAGVVALIAAGWIASGGRPGGVLQFVLLFGAAGAMGVQSGAVQGLNVPGLSSTYMTGTLTLLLARLTVQRRLDARSAITLSALVVGAAVGGTLVFVVPDAAPLFPLAVLAFAIAAATLRQSRASTADEGKSRS